MVHFANFLTLPPLCQEIDDDCTLIRIISARKTDKSERKRYENDF